MVGNVQGATQSTPMSGMNFVLFAGRSKAPSKHHTTCLRLFFCCNIIRMDGVTRQRRNVSDQRCQITGKQVLLHDGHVVVDVSYY